MNCSKCGGLMVYEQFRDYLGTRRHFEFMGWRCVSCGRIRDRVIDSRYLDRKEAVGPKNQRE
jgi:hypothetical protein